MSSLLFSSNMGVNGRTAGVNGSRTLSSRFMLIPSSVYFFHHLFLIVLLYRDSLLKIVRYLVYCFVTCRIQIFLYFLINCTFPYGPIKLFLYVHRRPNSDWSICLVYRPRLNCTLLSTHFDVTFVTSVTFVVPNGAQQLQGDVRVPAFGHQQ